MTMVSSGEISLGGSATSGGLNRSVNIELGRSATATISMNEAAVRGLFGVASGAISMSDGYGKANEFSFTISSNQTNANLRTLAVNAGWNQSSRVVATINSGVTISSNSTGTPALTINGSFPNGVELTNGGLIAGMGGAGGAGRRGNTGLAGAAGGLALSVSVGVTLRNNGTIAGGGGGGGAGGGAQYDSGNSLQSGGGGGGGRSSLTNSSGGGFQTAIINTKGWTLSNEATAGGSGTGSSAGGGGVGARSENQSASFVQSGGGASGGARGASGGTGVTATVSALQPPSLILYAGGGGGSGGGAISGNSNITYLATGTRLGAIT
jgi:hypothetical protein